ncbi:CPBP family intramembrane glutamic endopeptidase [Rhodoplanes roseus]|uniref:CAAX prenyl protease 2/Lysostaphin resistance protein A-like domain-containing protein n=1 Tax=Rhodoplanes roseus TaxID=29409 RepID=A0A327KP15_9BRAD|nr:CPBP family intramembrane glutamic endopeptidase [Rhodoplanes roseus]RAI40101.1 hypothetical protein CH341_24475 [Rhodoplanes roseus]
MARPPRPVPPAGRAGLLPAAAFPYVRGSWGIVVSLAWVLLAFTAETPLRDAVASAGLPATGGPGSLSRAVDSLAAWGATLLVILLAVRLTDVPLRDYVGWTRPRSRDLLRAAGFVLALYGALVTITVLAGTAGVHAGQPGRTATGAGAVAVVLAWGSTVLLAPVVEESIFRGFLWRAVQDRRGPVAALVLTTLVFAAFHWGYWMRGGSIDAVSVAQYLVIGGVLGAFRLTSGGTVAPMVAHALANAALAAFPTLVSLAM